MMKETAGSHALDSAIQYCPKYLNREQEGLEIMMPGEADGSAFLSDP